MSDSMRERFDLREAAAEIDTLRAQLQAAEQERDEERVAHNHFAVAMEHRALHAEAALTASEEARTRLEGALRRTDELLRELHDPIERPRRGDNERYLHEARHVIHTALASAASLPPEECRGNDAVTDRVCEHGTIGCVVRHSPPPEQEATRPSQPQGRFGEHEL